MMFMRLLDGIKHRPRVWDGIIALLACVFGGGMFLAPYPWNILDGIVFFGLIYCCFVEPWIIVVKRIPVTTTLQTPLTIAFVSDFHVGPYKGKRFMQRITDKTNALHADLILLGGDFLYNYEADPNLLEPLKGLKAPLGVFAVMGNHDSGRDVMHGIVTLTKDRTKDVEAILDACGIRTLHNESVILEKNGASFALAGTDDQWMESYDLGKTLENIPADLPVILLTHNPDAILDERTLRADLILSGHTHGGQVRLPLLGAFAGIPNELGRQYDRGTFSLTEKTTLIVSHGVGESTARPRFLACPEVLQVLSEPKDPFESRSR